MQNNNLPYLLLDEQGLAICSNTFKPLYVADIYQKLAKRGLTLAKELLIQAIRIKNKSKNITNVLDLTAGLAKDALLIAQYGYNVTMVEQNPILATIIYYALQHSYIPNNAKIIFMNSLDYLNNLNDNVSIDAIYLDPMFKHNKNAKAKKEMQLIQMITENFEWDNSNEILLFEKSLQLAEHKIVVKRDNKQPAIVTTPLPSFTQQGKTVRYDVYNITKPN